MIPWRQRLNVRPKEAAEILGLSLRSVRRMIASGELEVDRVGRAVRVRVSSLLEREVRTATPPPRKSHLRPSDRRWVREVLGRTS